MSVLVFYLTEASLTTHKNRTKPVSTHFFPVNKGLEKTIVFRSSGQKSSSFSAPRMYHYSCNSCMNLIFIFVSKTTSWFGLPLPLIGREGVASLLD